MGCGVYVYHFLLQTYLADPFLLGKLLLLRLGAHGITSQCIPWRDQWLLFDATQAEERRKSAKEDHSKNP